MKEDPYVTDVLGQHEKLFWQNNIYERKVVGVSKQKDSSYLSKQRSEIRYNLTISNAQINSRMNEPHIKTHPYAMLEYALEAYIFNNNINKTLIDERKQKQKGHEYGTHHFPFYINIHHVQRLGCHDAVIGFNMILV